jgi:ATP-dependent protease ClpP protease subunit
LNTAHVSKNFRFDLSRAIYITDKIDESMVTRIIPEVMRLQSMSSDPITVYIDSPGGLTNSMESILALLRDADQFLSNTSGRMPFRLITIARRNAMSAAADLLISGDYVVVYPETRILYHGVRITEDALTSVEASKLSDELRQVDNDFADKLRSNIEERFILIYLKAREERQNATNSNSNSPTDQFRINDFYNYLKEKLRPETSKDLLEKAFSRYEEYQKLHIILQKCIGLSLKSGTRSKHESFFLKELIDNESRNHENDSAWSYTSDGIKILAQKLVLLRESSGYSDKMMDWFETIAPGVLEREEFSYLQTKTEAERKSEYLRLLSETLEPVYLFIVALCHSLQEGENELLGEDAYWLGLVDEVYGSNLPNRRYIAEYQPSLFPDENIFPPEKSSALKKSLQKLALKRQR